MCGKGWDRGKREDWDPQTDGGRCWEMGIDGKGGEKMEKGWK